VASTATKGHVAIDPDSEIITATEVTPGNAADGAAAEALLADVRSPSSPTPTERTADESRGEASNGEATAPLEPVEVYGDASYGTAEIVEKIEAAGAAANVEVQGPSALSGHYGKDACPIWTPTR
jgi:hypothetical protein